MEIKSLYGKNYISIRDLVKCGFGYPKKGTKVAIISCEFWDVDNGSMWYKFFEKKEGYDSIAVSLWATEIGMKQKDESTVYVEFSTNTFTPNF